MADDIISVDFTDDEVEILKRLLSQRLIETEARCIEGGETLSETEYLRQKHRELCAIHGKIIYARARYHDPLTKKLREVATPCKEAQGDA